MAEDPPPGPVLVVGDLLVDVLAIPTGPLRVGSDVAASVRIGGGGSAANTACWIAHQLTPVRLHAALGADDLGASAGAALSSGGVEHVGPVVDGAPTGACVVIVGADGERTMLPDRGANEHLPPPSLRGDECWVHVSGYSLLHEGSRPAGVEALAAPAPTSVDAASSGPLRDLGAAAFLAMIAGVDLLFANADELDALGGLAAVLDAGIGAVVVKRGAAGAAWTDGTTTIDRPADPVRVVDTTGAGDALAAGFLARTRLGAGPDESLRAGLALAAQCVAHPGARP